MCLALSSASCFDSLTSSNFAPKPRRLPSLFSVFRSPSPFPLSLLKVPNITERPYYFINGIVDKVQIKFNITVKKVRLRMPLPAYGVAIVTDNIENQI